MALVLYVLLKNLPFWLPSFAAWYVTARARFAYWIVPLGWVPVAVATLLLAGEARREEVFKMVLVASVLGALVGFWNRRPPAA